MKLTDLFWGNSFGLKFAAMIAKAYYGAARDNMSKEHFSQVIDMCNDLWKHPEYQNKDPFFKSSILENWASSLRQRAIIDYSIEDALESIKLRRMVVSLNIKESMAFARGNLANSLFTYFDLTSDISTLEEAIVLLRQAVEFFETGQSLDIPLPGFLKKVEGNAIDVSTNLAHILSVKYTSTKQISYLQESISIQEDCIQKAPKNDPDLWWYHLQLSNYFHEHFKYYNNKLSLNNAISNIKQAISLLEPNKTFYYGALNNCNRSGRI